MDIKTNSMKTREPAYTPLQSRASREQYITDSAIKVSLSGYTVVGCAMTGNKTIAGGGASVLCYRCQAITLVTWPPGANPPRGAGILSRSEARSHSEGSPRTAWIGS